MVKLLNGLNIVVLFKLYLVFTSSKATGSKYSYEYKQMINAGHMLLMVLYDRNCRRSFTPENHWIIR